MNLESGVKKEYTFDNYVVGSHNGSARTVALSVAEAPGELYNPLFLYGGVGTGKTHLLHAIAHFIRKNDESLKVHYLTGEDFTSELLEVIQNGGNDFTENFRDVDVLLIDDIQFFAGKESTQKELCHIFDMLCDSNRQIIVSGDKPPRKMQFLEKKLCPLFEEGLICGISAPDYEARVAILRKKQEIWGYDIGNEIIEYIASHITSDIRELEGALVKVKTYARLMGKEIDMDFGNFEGGSLAWITGTESKE